ncbi:hypothetical protein LUZ63_014920 [Rhynchospora breviuscula]|uniref:K Homology domain-containing protein n=1 Tax=Rhynchospora breviuscula TaxID=2022672 RepID=A0A9Q0HMA4_9POAL|nr:hypothetical protein LUZ63_014920 [Rhynchospora breviuscula]
MERSRSKRGYNYDPDLSPPPHPHPHPRSRPRYNDNRRRPNHQHRRGSFDERRLQPPPQPPSFVPPAVGTDGGPPPGATTVYRLLCPEYKLDEVLGEPIAQIQAQTHAWITVHRPAPGDSVRVIETSDDVPREPDGRPPQFSPAQDALLLVHRRIVDVPDPEDVRDRNRDRELDDDEDGPSKVVTRMVIPRLHVGCLLGRGGNIIEQMRKETKTHIRILPRDHDTPGCVSMSEEVLQVVGEVSCVKRAIAIISDRLKESLHRDRSSFRDRDRHHPPEGDYIPSTQHLPPIEERYFDGPDRFRNEFDSNGNPFVEFSNQQVNSYEAIVFRILCPSEKVDVVMGGPPGGMLETLRSDVGVDVRVSDPIAGSDERVVIVTSQEGPDNELFPAQEALLHIQTHIVDLGPDKDNVITTRLLISSKEIFCLEGRGGLLSEINKSCSANVQILPKGFLPICAFDSDELIQIVGEIRAARNALVQITAKLRSYLFRDVYEANDMPQAPYPGPNSDIISPSLHERYHGTEIASMSVYPRSPLPGGQWHPKDVGGSASGSFEQEASNGSDEGRQNSLKRVAVPIVSRSTLEVIIPKIAVEILTMRSKNKLAQISQISGATVTLDEETPDATDGVVQISGTPEQADKAQSLLQGFILSIQDDIP